MTTLNLFERSVLSDVKPTKLRKYQELAIQWSREQVREGKKRILLVGPTGCHASGQGILMFDGSVKLVETVHEGDLLMGPDSSPREVVTLHRGRSRMYRIVPIKGDPWIVNEDHVLTLVRTNTEKRSHLGGTLVDVTVKEWLSWPKWRKHIHKLFRVSVNFSTRSLLRVDPYILGAYLGDGWTTETQLSFAVGGDSQLESAIEEEASLLGLTVRRDASRGESNIVCVVRGTGGPGTNSLRNAIRVLGLHRVGSGEKFVPRVYLTSSRKDRLSILAGLFDTDGSLVCSGGGYDYLSKSKRLADDVAFIARSVGFAAYVKKSIKRCQTGVAGTYWRVSISGDTSIVPCRITRKVARVRLQKKDVLRTGFSVEPAGEGDFYGFTVDKDHRYLLDDFTVTHNCGKMRIISSTIQTSTVPALFVAHREELINQCVSQLAGLGITNVGVMRGDDDRTDSSASTQIASIQTLARRKKPLAGLVFVDEAHRSMSDSYQEHVFDHYREEIILGFTATPTRLDGRPLGNNFEVMKVFATYADMIRQGFIVAPECYDGGPDNPNLANVRISGGDYDETQLGEVMRDTTLIGGLLSHWQKLAHMYPHPDGTIGMVEGPRRRTIIFAVNIAHSLDICERFSKAGVRIAHVDGNTKEALRQQAIRALGNGELDAISNCNILLEGTDIPSAKCALHARPTQSIVLARQSVGRIMRPWHPGCPDGCLDHPSQKPLFLDHAGIIATHGFPHEDLHWELNAKARRIEHKDRLKLCKACFAYVPASRMICPYCSVEFSAEEELKEKEIKETKDQLVRRSTTPEDMKRAFFDNMVKLARSKGNKPGFASYGFKRHYGMWPPWAWSEEVKSSFASDQQWQSAVEAKQIERERREAAKKSDDADADERAAIEAESPPDEVIPPEPEEDDSFGGWLEEEGIE